jgi:capsule polysaccharide export protein KpsE/RkpR
VGIRNPRVDRAQDVPEDTLQAAHRGPARVFDASERDTSENLRLVWEQRSLIYKVAVRALILSSIIVLLLPLEYESTVSIMPPDSSSDMGTMMAAVMGKASPELAALAGSVFGVKTSGAVLVDLLQSRTVQNRIVDRFNLQKLYWTRYKENARKTLNRRTEVKEDRKSGVISLTVMDHSPGRAHDMAQAYVEEVNHLQAEVSTSSARRERIFLEQRLASVKADLEDAEKQFSVYASKNATLDIKEQAKAMVESAALLQGQMIAAQSELQALEQIYTPANIRVRTVKARIEELRRQLQKVDGTDAGSPSSSSQSDELYPSIRKLPLLGVEWMDLYRRVKVQETVFELLTQKYELVRLQEAKEIPSINVIDSANTPEKKSGPHRVLIVLGVTFLSIAGAMAWIVGSARVQKLDRDDPRRIVFLGTVTKVSQFRQRCAQQPALAWMGSVMRGPRSWRS